MSDPAAYWVQDPKQGRQNKLNMINSSTIKTMGILLSWVIVLAQCTKDKADPPLQNPGDGDEGPVTPANVTFENFGRDLFQNNCASCHSIGGEGAGRWIYTGYGSVSDNLGRINQVAIVARTMPKGGSLTTEQYDLLKAWIDKGAPVK